MATKYIVLSKEKKETILQVFNYLEKESESGPRFSSNQFFKKTKDIFGISDSALRRIIKNKDKDNESKPEIEKKSRRSKFDEFEKDVIKRTVYSFFERNETLTLKKLKCSLKEKHDIEISKFTLFKLLHELGFKYKKAGNNREVICERIDLVRARSEYLHKIREKRKDGYSIIYTDETWVNASHTSGYQWCTPDARHNRKLPTGRGQRLIVLHAGCKEQGFLPGCDLVFKSKSTDGRDYHTEMNGEVFTEWVNKQLIPALPGKSLVVMDNAPYHSMRAEENKCPTSNSRKADMQEWLLKNGIEFRTDMKKPELYEIIKQNKPPPEYKIDNIIKAAGHEVLRLPPYHCNFNPIELIWANLKNHIAIENNTFKLEDVRTMVHDGFRRITQTEWSKCVEHAIKEEQKYWESDGLLETVPRVVINLDEDSDSE